MKRNPILFALGIILITSLVLSFMLSLIAVPVILAFWLSSPAWLCLYLITIPLLVAISAFIEWM